MWTISTKTTKIVRLQFTISLIVMLLGKKTSTFKEQLIRKIKDKMTTIMDITIINIILILITKKKTIQILV